MSTFVAIGNSYAAKGPNHDDLMMNLVMFGWFTSTDVFSNLTDINMKNMLYKERLAEIQDDMLPFGFTPDSDSAEVPRFERDGDGNLWMESSTFDDMLR